MLILVTGTNPSNLEQAIANIDREPKVRERFLSEFIDLNLARNAGEIQ